MEILGYIGSVFIGITLGLIGSGGSILTVPIMVYLMGISPVTATAYSLFVVGFTSLIGAGTYMKKSQISYLTAFVFAVPAFIAVFLTRSFIVPAIPESILEVGGFELKRGMLIMLLFAFLMLGASFSMIKNKKKDAEGDGINFNYPLILIEGLVVGVLTGLVGAGGGFLIIPALVLFANLPMKLAVGTSLLIIAVKSLIGFMGDISADLSIDWSFLFLFTLFATGGIIAGSYLSKRIKGSKLKPLFGWFVLAMGVFIIIKETIFIKIN